MTYGPSTVNRRRTRAELAEVDEAIVTAIEADHPVTLRGVYYRVVAAGAVEKTEAGYRLVGRQLLKLRRSGSVSYSTITDGTRWITKPTTWSDVDEMLNDAAASYRRALWRRQEDQVMMFTEKDAISGVILPVTGRWDVPLGVLRGYCSESFAHNVAEDIADWWRYTELVDGVMHVYQLGDHDPSGVGAWEDFAAKVGMFLGVYLADAVERYVEFRRLAVTIEQIEELELPTRPTKQSDTRAKGWDGGSVEVDAIPAPVLRQLVEDAITQHIDPDQLQVDRVAEASERELLTRMRGAV